MSTSDRAGEPMNDSPGRERCRPRWYHGMWHEGGERGKVQIDNRLRDAVNEYRRRDSGPFTLPEHVLRLAHAEYDRQHPGQPYERMQERGGLSVLEVLALLADQVERLQAELDETQLRSIEARNPGIDIDEVRRLRDAHHG